MRDDLRIHRQVELDLCRSNTLIMRNVKRTARAACCGWPIAVIVRGIQRELDGDFDLGVVSGDVVIDPRRRADDLIVTKFNRRRDPPSSYWMVVRYVLDGCRSYTGVPWIPSTL